MALEMKGTEPSLKQILNENPDICKAIYSLSSVQDFSSLSVFRKPFYADFVSLADKVLHVLILKYEGYKYSRNPNAYQVELHCATQFFGPIVVALNMVNPPYSLCDFTLNDLKELQKYNTKLNKSFPLPPSATTKANHISSNDYSMEVSYSIGNLDAWFNSLDPTTFYSYRFKTAYCQHIQQKHDWAKCIYAHRQQDFRRPPDIYHYIPEDCPFLMKVPAEDCTSGKNCTYCHSTVERLYHPTKYKTLACESVKKKKECPRGEQCAFYHSVNERRDQKKIEIPKKMLSLDLKPPVQPQNNSQSFHVPSDFYETPYEDVRSSVKTTFSECFEGPKRSFGPFHGNNGLSSFLTMEDKMKQSNKMHLSTSPPESNGEISDPLWKYNAEKNEEDDLLKDPKIQYALGSLD